MIPKNVAAWTAMLALGCQDPAESCGLSESCPQAMTDMKTSCALPDLVPPTPRCAAAKGLAGDALVCVDFDKVSGLTDQALTGWDFTSLCPAGWQIVSGKLQVKNFGGFVGTCSFTMPQTDLGAAANQKYQSVTLAVVQRVDLNSLQQKAQVMLGGDDDQQRLLDWMTGKQPRKQWVQTITKSDLPALSASSFQPWFKLNSAVVVGGTAIGWQIESIAVMGNP